MATLVAFVAQLVTSTVDLFRIFVFDVALKDPISLISWAVGGLLTTVAVLVFAYLALGALADALGANATRNRPPAQRVE